jgi:hypothetical protein
MKNTSYPCKQCHEHTAPYEGYCDECLDLLNKIRKEKDLHEKLDTIITLLKERL